MPTNGSGVYTLPATYLAVSGNTILASQHNDPLEDIEDALTDRYMRDGRAPLTGNMDAGTNNITNIATLSAVDLRSTGTGTAADPDFSFTGDTDTGMYRISANVLGIAVAGAEAARYTSGGFTTVGYVAAGTQFRGLGTDGATAPSFAWDVDLDTGMYRVGSDTVGWACAGAEAARLTASGLTTVGWTTSTLFRVSSSDSASAPGHTWSGDTNTGFFSAGADAIGVTVGGTQIARFDAAGMGLGVNPVGTSFLYIENTSLTYSNGLIRLNDTRGAGAGSQTIQQFRREGTAVGNITTTSSATAYGTSSDYRLKENVADLTGSGDFIDAIRPVSFTWKVDGSQDAGFIAHEFAVVSPQSVNGEKDAVDEDGLPIHQSMQASTPHVMANIIAELQSLRLRVAALEGA